MSSNRLKNKKMVTIKEVARIAGVSVGTVSNVLNDLPTVTVENKRKVNSIIKNLGYTPNKIAASLSNKKTKNIGLIVTDISSPFYSDLIKSITKTLEKYGYNVFLCGSDDDPKKETDLIKDLISMWVDGIILIPTNTKERDISFFKKIDIPLVVVNREISGLDRDLVVFDNFKGAYDGTSYMIEKGNKKIILLTGSRDSRSAVERYNGWEKAMSDNDLYDDSLEYWGDYSIDSGYVMAKESFENVEGIEAFFSASDLIALGAIKFIKERELRIPEDISVMGFGDIYLSQFLSPALSTIKRPFNEIGKLSALIMVERLNTDKNHNKKRIIVDGELIIRGSTKNSNA